MDVRIRVSFLKPKVVRAKVFGKHCSGICNGSAICGDDYGTCNAISQDERFLHLHYYFPKYVCSVQYGRCLQFLDIILPWHVSQVFNLLAPEFVLILAHPVYKM